MNVRIALWRTAARIHPRMVIGLILVGLAIAAPFGALATAPPTPPTIASDAPTETPLATPDPTSSTELPPTPLETAPPAASMEPPPAASTEPPPAAPTEPPPPEPSPPAEPARPYIVTLAAGIGPADWPAVVASVGGEIEWSIDDLRMASVRLPSAASADLLKINPAVARIEQDRAREVEGMPSDSRAAEQWALPRIGWDRVWGSVSPNAETLVAVLDTGVDADHPDLIGSLVPGASFVDGAAADTDGNGHGTWMAGIIAAATDNSTGVAGVAWGSVRVLPVTVLDAAGVGRDSDIIRGLVHAVDSGADVVLMAFSSASYSAALQAAIDYAWAHDVVVVAAAGNDGSAVARYPAGDRGVIGVASSDHGDALSASSNFGSAAFIAAPGIDILTTARDAGYSSVSGTSAAAAVVAGAAGLMRAVDPSADNGVIVARLARNATSLADGDEAGNGRLDLARSIADSSNATVRPAGAWPDGPGGPFLGPYAAAATATWTGAGGDNLWTTAANWGGVAPVAGDDLVFPLGAAQLSNVNNFAAGTAFDSITISGTGYLLAGNSVALGVGGLSATGTASANTISLPIVMAASRPMAVSDAGSSVLLSGIVSGAGGVAKSGPGVLALSAGNTYTGATGISAGSIEVRSNAALGTTAGNTVVSPGAALTLNGTGLVVAEPLNLNGSGVGGAGVVHNLANANTLSGTMTLAGAATVASDSGTLTLSGGVTTAGFVLTVDGAGNTTKSGVAISGTGGLTKEGAGTLTLGIANTYSGPTLINVGTVRLSVANGIGSSSAVSVASGATFDLGGFSDTVGSLAGAGSVTSSVAGAVTLTAGGNNGSTTFSGTLADGSGVVALTKAGTGTFTVSGANAHTGATRINTGTLSIAADAALGTPPGAPTAGQLVFGGGTLLATTSFTLDANRGIAMTSTGTISVAPGVTLTYGGTTAGSGNLTKSGTGVLALSGSNGHTGITAVSAGIVRVQSDTALGTTAAGTTVTSGAAIEIDGVGLTVAEPITSLSGTGVGATGVLRNLANSNTWSGSIVLAAAARINSDAGTLTLGGNVTGNAQTLTLGGAGATVVGGVVGTTTGALIKDSAGTATLAAANTYTGATTISGGTLRVGVANAIFSTSAVSVASGATFDLAGLSVTIGSLAGAGSVTTSVAGSVTLTTGGNNTSTTFSGVASDGAGVLSMTKAGTGTQTLSGANTFSDPLSINGGTVSVPNDTALGAQPASPIAGRLSFSGGTLVASASFTMDPDRGVSLAGAGTISTGSGITLTYGGVIAGTGTLAKAGTGTLTLSGSNTYSGSTTISAGTISIAADAALGTPPGAPVANQLTFTGGTLLATTSLTLDANRGVTLTGAGTLSVNAAQTLSYSGVISGPGTLAKTGTGTLSLAGGNTYTGITTLAAGVLVIAADDALGTPPGAPVANQLTFTGGTLRATATLTLNANRGVTLTGAATFSVDPSVSLAYAGTIGGTSTLTKTGTGSLSLAGSNTYSGATTVSAGVLRVGSATALGTTAGATSVATGAVIELDGSGLVVAEPVSSLIGTGIGATGALRNLANDNSWTGAIVLGSGGARINSDADTLTLSGGFTGATRPLTVGGAGNTLISGVIATTTGTLTKDGPGTLTLAAVNSYSGATSVAGGIVRLAIANAIGGSSAMTVASGATFDLGGFSDTIGSLAGAGSVTSSVAGAVTLTAGGNNGSTTFSGTLSDGSGVVALAKAGTGTLTLSGSNTYSGSTTISAGTISIAADAALGTPPGAPVANQLTFTGGTLLATTSLTLDANRGVTLTGAGTLSVNAAQTLSYAGVISGPGTLAKTGTGTLSLAGGNTYTGITTLAAGVLVIAADDALGTPPGAPVANQLTFTGGTLRATATLTLNANRGVTLTGAATFSVDPSVSLAYAGTIGGTSTLTKTGTGSLSLAGSNTYSGATTVSAGVLRVGSATALGTTAGATSVATGAVIELDGSGLVVAEPVSSLIGTGIGATGALRNLANDNSWTGAIVLGSGGARINSDADTLTLSGGFTGATRPLTVGGAGNTLISGIIATTTGTLTKDGPGTLTLAAVNSYSGRTSLNAGVTVADADTDFGAPPVSLVTNQLSFGGGTLSVPSGFSMHGNRGIQLSGVGGAIDIATGATLTHPSVLSGNSAFTKSGPGTLDLTGATVMTGDLSIAAGSLLAPTATMLDVNGNLANNSGPGALVAGSGTLTLSGTANQAVGGLFALDLSGLTVTNANGVTLTAGVTVDGTLSLTSGVVSTGANVLYVSPTGSVARTNGRVFGNLRKHVPVGAPVVAFEIGDAAQYAPVTLTFSNVSVAGEVTATTATPDHPALASSTIDPALSVNRYWSLTPLGLAFTDVGTVFEFGAADIDAGADPNDFVVARYDGVAWQTLSTVIRTPTSTGATGVTALGDFAIGALTGTALDHFVVSAGPTATAGAPIDATVTAVDAAGNRVATYAGTITFSSSDPHAAFLPPTYGFTPTDHGVVTLTGVATLRTAAAQTLSVVDGSLATGTSGTITVGPGPFSRLQIIVPGETADPGSATGKLGAPTTQIANTAFAVAVNATDDYWNLVSAADLVGITSSDGAATLPPDAPLVAGSASFNVTLQAGGPTTVTATDLTDGTKSASNSAPIPVTNNAPIAGADSYEVVADNELVVPALGVLANDTDPDLQPVSVGMPRPVSGPSNGTLLLNADGSFVYTPNGGFNGTDTFSYVATDSWTTSLPATVTIIVRGHTLISSSGWGTTFDGGRYLDLHFPAYVAPGSTVTGAQLDFSYRSLDAAGTACWYVEIYEGATLIATHGSAASPISCNGQPTYQHDGVLLAEVNTAARANDLTARIYFRDSAGARSEISQATLTVDSFLR